MFTTILWNLFYILVFPGFLFCFVIGLLLSGIDRKVLARMQKRKGPPIIQPFYDFFKLLGKETIIPHNASRKVFILAPLIGLAGLVVMELFIPIFGFSAFSGVADIIVILYLLTIPSVAIIMGGAASGSPYAGVGISREMVSIISYELPLIIILLAVAKKVGLSLDGGLAFSFSAIAEYQAASGPMITHWALIPAAIAMLFVIPCEVGAHPFDVAEAEVEICEGPLVEYSGSLLGVFKLNNCIKMLIMTSLFTALFLGGAGTGIVALDALIFVAICVVVTIICMTLLHAITARLKVEKVFKFYWTIVTGLALISLILVWLGL